MFQYKWKYSINPKTFDDLDETRFKNHKFSTVLSYIIFVVFLNLLKVALFISDIYTCVKLLAFNSWGNNIIKPYLSFKISKWLFSGCIFCSIVLLIWTFIRGYRVYRTNNIALSYINGVCNNYYSLKSYSMFCVFEELTAESRFQKLAFFTFFELKSCFRFLVADTPRQVINGLTLWSVLISSSNGKTLYDLESASSLLQKIKFIAKTNHEEAILLSFMFFSFSIWFIFFIKLSAAIVFAPFIYQIIIEKRKYRSLREYVCVKINKKVDELIKEKKDVRSFEKHSPVLDYSTKMYSNNIQTSIFENSSSNLEKLQSNNFSTSTDQLLEIQYLTRGKYKDTEYVYDEYYKAPVQTENKSNTDLKDVENFSEGYNDKYLDSDFDQYKDEWSDDQMDVAPNNEPLRITSMIMDTGMCYFRDEVYTFDLQKQFQPFKFDRVESNTYPDNLQSINKNVPVHFNDIQKMDSRDQSVQFDLQSIGFQSRKYDTSIDGKESKTLRRPLPPINTTNHSGNKVLLNKEFNGSTLEVMDKVHKVHHDYNIYTPISAHFTQSNDPFFNNSIENLSTEYSKSYSHK